MTPFQPTAMPRMAALPLCALVCALLGACGSTKTTSSPSVSIFAPEPEGVRSFEKKQFDTATALEQQGAYHEAAQAWEVLNLLRPGQYESRHAAALAKADTRAQDLLGRAQQAHKRGETTEAERYYLGVMAQQPENKDAAEGLRAIERARNRQEFLLKPGRAQQPADNGAKRPAAAPVASNSLAMEQASNLARLGDINGAIDLMAGQLNANPGDQGARDLLADLYFKKAQSLQGKDKDGALAAAKSCLQVQSKHAGCRTFLPAAPPSAAAPAPARKASAPTRTGAFSPAKP